MYKFQKKPVVIEAFQWGDLSIDSPDWYQEAIQNGTIILSDPPQINNVARIVTLEGDMTVAREDWVIRGVKGELYPCKPDIFEETYEKL